MGPLATFLLSGLAVAIGREAAATDTFAMVGFVTLVDRVPTCRGGGAFVTVELFRAPVRREPVSVRVFFAGSS